ncbi:hypothetical protein [Nocardia altamirensis]|uniref:hypothetical protein n=1 Tax=Nocardia altamirensis TaxID=472158 RepID=UPI001C3FAA0D|nr:hypothetical protein [Nocardia altamirensis]
MKELLSRLPDIPTLRDRCRALAMLDAILSPEWEDRFYSFDSGWAEGEELASMRDGSGNQWFIVFAAAGVYGQGFDHEAPNAPEVLDPVPAAFASCVEEPAFGDEVGPLVTVCFWREPADPAWGISVADRGGEGLFDVLVEGTPEAYQEFAEDYYEFDLGLSIVQHVFALRPLTQEVIAELDPDLELADLDEDIAQIGYPR